MSVRFTLLLLFDDDDDDGNDFKDVYIFFLLEFFDFNRSIDNCLHQILLSDYIVCGRLFWENYTLVRNCMYDCMYFDMYKNILLCNCDTYTYIYSLIVFAILIRSLNLPTHFHLNLKLYSNNKQILHFINY